MQLKYLPTWIYASIINLDFIYDIFFKLFESTLIGIFNPRTGEKDRHGIIGGNSMFRPEYNSVFLFTDNNGAEYYLNLYTFRPY